MFDFYVFTIYDRVSGEYGDLFLAKNNALAIRRFNYVMSNAPMVSDDCQLYCVGCYAQSCGTVNGYDKPEFICNYNEVVNE